MATSIHHDSQRGFGTVSAPFNGLAERYRTWAARRQQVARTTLELQSYTDRQLADLGLTRSDIPQVARGTFRRP